MDGTRFDRVTRTLAGPTGRRSAIAAIAAVAAAPFARRLPGLAPGTEASKRPGASGACGPRKLEGNACRAHGDCCTGFCRKDLSNRDGLGRCRCVRAGGSCAKGQTCCGKLACRGGVCASSADPAPTPVPTPTPAPTCDASSCPTGCCQGATCLPGTEVSACGTGGLACVVCSGGTPYCTAGLCDVCFGVVGC